MMIDTIGIIARGNYGRGGRRRTGAGSREPGAGSREPGERGASGGGGG